MPHHRRRTLSSHYLLRSPLPSASPTSPASRSLPSRHGHLPFHFRTTGVSRCPPYFPPSTSPFLAIEILPGPRRRILSLPSLQSLSTPWSSHHSLNQYFSLVPHHTFSPPPFPAADLTAFHRPPHFIYLDLPHFLAHAVDVTPFIAILIPSSPTSRTSFFRSHPLPVDTSRLLPSMSLTAALRPLSLPLTSRPSSPPPSPTSSPSTSLTDFLRLLAFALALPHLRSAFFHPSLAAPHLPLPCLLPLTLPRRHSFNNAHFYQRLSLTTASPSLPPHTLPLLSCPPAIDSSQCVSRLISPFHLSDVMGVSIVSPSVPSFTAAGI